MGTTDWILAAYSILFCMAWYISNIQAINALFLVPLFEKENPSIPKYWPRLSIVIAACNEADIIEQAISTLLQQDYPDLEIILVNDRSTDKTGDIIDNIADRDARVQIIHIENLPQGWLGKVYAMQVGTRKVSGEWILYTDADVFFQQGALRKAVAFAIAEQSDHLALMPAPDTDSFWLDVVMRTFGVLFLQSTRAADAGKPGSDVAIGVGAFNMVRKSVFDKTKGFEWLRMEVIDDVGLGLLLHDFGAKTSFAITRQDISLTWYPSIRAMFKGLEKNLFGGAAHYSFLRMMFIVGLLWAFALAPFVAIFARVPYLWIFGVLVYLFIVAGALVSKLILKQRLLPSLFVQVGQIIFSLMLLRSGVMCILRKGIIWRGTKYTIDDLRAGQRVKMQTF